MSIRKMARIKNNQPKRRLAETGHNVGASPTPKSDTASVGNFGSGRVTPMPNRMRFYKKNNLVFMRSDALTKFRLYQVMNFAKILVDEINAEGDR